MKRVLLLGDKGTGKTTFLNIFLNKQLSNHYDQTLGIQAAAKTVQFKDHSFVNLQIWDTPGQTDYLQMAFPFYQNCKFFILMVDRSNKEALKSFSDWMERIYEHSLNKASNILVILNKTGEKQLFGRSYLNEQFHKQMQESPYQFFNITFLEIDLLKQKETFENDIIRPYLYQFCKDQIVIESNNSARDRGCGQGQCAPTGCLLM